MKFKRIVILIIFIALISVRYFSFSSPKVEENVYFDQLKECLPRHIKSTVFELFHDYFSLYDDENWQQKAEIKSLSFDELLVLIFGPRANLFYRKRLSRFNRAVERYDRETSLTETHLISMLNEIKIPIHFIIDVNCHLGKSTKIIATTLRSIQKPFQTILICVDTWLNDLGQWKVNQNTENAFPIHGRSSYHQQFITNIVMNNLTENVVPFPSSTIAAARFLFENRIVSQIIFFNHIYSEGEHYINLELYWTILENGGLFIGENWQWPQIRCNLYRFVQSKNVSVNHLGDIWFIKKRDDVYF